MLAYLDAMSIKEFVRRLQVAKDADTKHLVAVNVGNTRQLLLLEAKREVRLLQHGGDEQAHGEGAWCSGGSRDGDRDDDDEAAAAKTRGLVGAATEAGASTAM